MESVESKDGGVLLRVKVQPKASRNAWVREKDGRLRVALMAPPVEGAANKALTALVAKTLGVPKRSVQLLSGERSREKTLFVCDITVKTVLKKLLEA